jgi:sn-glycerol 3-phosphate transport system ATP-binding protein
LEVAANKIFFFGADGNRIGEEDGRFHEYIEALRG